VVHLSGTRVWRDFRSAASFKEKYIAQIVMEKSTEKDEKRVQQEENLFSLLSSPLPSPLFPPPFPLLLSSATEKCVSAGTTVVSL